MFALWYLTLALEELRKRLGWGSFFSNSNQTSSVNPPNTKLILPKENIVSAPAPPTPQAPTTPPAPPTIVPVKKAGSTIETIPDSDNNFHFNDQDIVPTTPTLDFSDTENELSSLKDEHIAEILDEDISSPSSDNTTESDDFEITANVNDEIYTNDEPDNNKSMKFINEENTNFPKPPLTKPATMGGSVSSFLDAESQLIADV